MRLDTSLPDDGGPVVGIGCTTLSEMLEAVARLFPERDAYVEGPERLTFRQWLGRADALAAHLRDTGVKVGDVVAVLLPSSIDYAICYAAVIRIGAVMSGINLRLGPLEIGAILKKAEPRLTIIAEEARLPEEAMSGEQLLRGGLSAICKSGATIIPHVGGVEDPVAIIWTSGTTGLPKGAWFDHRAMASAVPLAGAMTRAFDRRLVATPFAHAGYMGKLWEQCAFAVTNIISPQPWRASDMLRLIEQEQITVAPAVPAQWEKFVALSDLSSAQFEQLRLCVTATAPMPPALAARIRAVVGKPLIARYAMTECPTITGTVPDDDDEVVCNTVGRAAPGATIRVVDDAGALLPPGKVGRISLQSPAMMRGYWRDSAGTDSVLGEDGWLTTGDLGLVDERGNLRLRGRTTDMFIRGGYNIYPAEVEAVLERHQAVQECAVIGTPAPVVGEVGVAFVALRGDAMPTTEHDLQAWCGAQLADYKVPSRIIFIDLLPRTPMQKIDRRALTTSASALPTDTMRGWTRR